MTSDNSKVIASAMQSKKTRSKWSTEIFIIKAKLVHGDRYNYSKVISKSTKDYVEIICDEHGVFMQRGDSHLIGRGCPQCSGNKKYTKNTFVDKSRLVHGYRYDYSKSLYKNNETKLEIICLEHGSFFQQPNSHFKGSGCPECYKDVAGGHSRSTYVERCLLNHNGLANLYIIRCNDDQEEFYKVGITSLDLKQRFNKGTLPYEYEVMVFFKDNAGFIWDFEKQLHRTLMNYKYKPRKKFHGRFECFSEVPKKVYRLIDKFNKSDQLQLIG